MIIGFDGKKAVLNSTGIGNYSRRCLNAISTIRSDFKLVLFSPDHSNSGVLADLPSTVKLSVPVWPFKRGLLYEVWRNFISWHTIRKRKVKVFHGMSNELPFWIGKSGCRTVVTIHDLIFLRHPEWYDKTSCRILRRKTKYACIVADRIIAVSERTKRDIMHFYGVEESRIEVIYQSLSPIFWEQLPCDMVRMKCNAYNLPPTYILCVGTIEQRKNHEILIKALPYLPKHLSLVFVGKATPYQETLRQMALKEKWISRIHFRNGMRTEDLPAIYQGSRMMAYMSKYEGFGIPVIEALASGIPVIAATGSCLEEAGGPDSIYLSPDNPKELAQVICRLDSDDALRQQMSARGKVYAKRFTDRQMGERLVQLYNKLMEV